MIESLKDVRLLAVLLLLFSVALHVSLQKYCGLRWWSSAVDVIGRLYNTQHLQHFTFQKFEGFWIPVTYLALRILDKAFRISAESHTMITGLCEIKINNWCHWNEHFKCCFLCLLACPLFHTLKSHLLWTEYSILFV